MHCAIDDAMQGHAGHAHEPQVHAGLRLLHVDVAVFRCRVRELEQLSWSVIRCRLLHGWTTGAVAVASGSLVKLITQHNETKLSVE